MMIQEEESLKKRLISSIQACRAEMETLYLELQLPIFEVKALKIIWRPLLRAQSDIFKSSFVNWSCSFRRKRASACSSRRRTCALSWRL